jgi:hypothetical protein
MNILHPWEPLRKGLDEAIVGGFYQNQFLLVIINARPPSAMIAKTAFIAGGGQT